MNHTSIFINLLAGTCFVFSLLKNRQKTIQALKIAVRAFWRMLPMVLFILLLITLMMGFLNKQLISQWFGEKRGGFGILIAAVTGAILQVPSIVSFPLAASLIQKGAAVTTIATFITTLTMIGFVTLPLEIKELGKRFAFWRNGLSLAIAFFIGLLIGALI